MQLILSTIDLLNNSHHFETMVLVAVLFIIFLIFLIIFLIFSYIYIFMFRVIESGGTDNMILRGGCLKIFLFFKIYL